MHWAIIGSATHLVPEIFRYCNSNSVFNKQWMSPGNTVTVSQILSVCPHDAPIVTNSQLDLQPKCQRWTGIYTQPAQLTG